MAGKALSSGALGDTVRIQNSSSKKEIEAVVTGVATVQVNM
jgi:flagella basal body P-ring formation protein FlgA